MDSYAELVPWMVDAIASLSPREKEVLWLLDYGLLQKEIAVRLGVSPTRISAVRAKLQRHFNWYRERAKRNPFLYDRTI